MPYHVQRRSLRRQDTTKTERVPYTSRQEEATGCTGMIIGQRSLPRGIATPSTEGAMLSDMLKPELGRDVMNDTCSMHHSILPSSEFSTNLRLCYKPRYLTSKGLGKHFANPSLVKRFGSCVRVAHDGNREAYTPLGAIRPSSHWRLFPQHHNLPDLLVHRIYSQLLWSIQGRHWTGQTLECLEDEYGR